MCRRKRPLWNDWIRNGNDRRGAHQMARRASKASLRWMKLTSRLCRPLFTISVIFSLP